MSTINAEKEGLSSFELDLTLAFSHWTFYITKHYLMVVDLQGVLISGFVEKYEKTFLLTDPSIHCIDPTRFKPMNFREKGFQSFFNGHECNSICKLLSFDSE